MSARCELSNITIYGRILRKESVDIQKPIFTKWANAFLKKAHLEIKDLFTDLADGKMLMKLLEIISGESIGIPNEGVLRAQKLDNLNRCFHFLRKKIHFENIGEEDICDGNPQLILGLIWTIILRFQIQEIEIEVDDEDEGGEKIYANDALLLWCQRKTAGYHGVSITNFTTSWRNGLGFNALIHAHRPDIIDYAALIPSEHMNNLNNAFSVAEEKLGIYKMVDAGDVDVHQPDEQVIITYVASYYHYFAKKKTEKTEEKRIAQFYTEITEAESWMNEKIPALTSPELGKDEDSVQLLLKKLDALDRDIDNFQNNIGELAALSRSLVDRGHYDSDNIKSQQTSLEEKYQELQDLSNQRRVKLMDTKKFFEYLREAEEVATWISDKSVIAGSEDYGSDLEHVEILIQKFEDFVHELNASEDRVTAISAMAKSMVDAGHYEKDRILKREGEIKQMCAKLKEITASRHENLAAAKQVHIYGHDADDTLSWIQEKDAIVSCDDYGHDLESVQLLVNQNEGLERDLAAIREQVEAITKEAERLIGQFPDAQAHIAAKHEEMLQAWNSLVGKATLRKEKLNQAEQLQIYFNDCRELTAWISEKMAVIMAMDFPKDLLGAEATMTQWKEHKAEVDSRQDAVNKFLLTGQAMIQNGHFLSEEIQEKVTDLNAAWGALLKVMDQQRKLCEQNLEVQDFDISENTDVYTSYGTRTRDREVDTSSHCGGDIEIKEWNDDSPSGNETKQWNDDSPSGNETKQNKKWCGWFDCFKRKKDTEYCKEHDENKEYDATGPGPDEKE